MATSILPDSAPFSDEQRAWLNGFFAGMLGVEQSGSNVSKSANPSGSSPVEPEVETEEEEFPWHDAALDLEERQKLAADSPLERQMMAAMAQLDCGACGYVCQTYGEAIATGAEKSLTLCTPGGRETSKALKKLVKLGGSSTKTAAPAANPSATPSASANGSSPQRDRNNPMTATLITSRPLNGHGSAKDTRHVVIDLKDSDLRYNVGDALGVLPTNCEELARAIIVALDATPETQVLTARGTLSLLQALQSEYCLNEPTQELWELLAQCAADSQEQTQLEALVEDDEAAEGDDVLDALKNFPSARPDPQSFINSLQSLKPRLYSIASSQKAHPSEVHLTVGKVTWNADTKWQTAPRLRKGVASTMLAERLGSGERLQVFVQPSHGFTVPRDPAARMIMVGPGTGIAPFIAFLQDREAIGAKGEHWLFFGDQHQETDFIYREELEGFRERGILNRIDLAFSRDQAEKIYVQDRMRERAAELFQWLESGAYFYVCGDASRMAVDVHSALLEIVQTQGDLDLDGAQKYLKRLEQAKRYARDVY